MNENSNKKPGELLPDELLWAEGGHASDVVLTTLADGELHLVPPLVRTHVEHCTACTTHLGHAALLSLHTMRELEVRAEHERAVARRPLPRAAITTGLLVALLGLVPSLFDAAGQPSAFRRFAMRDVPLSLHGLGTLVRHLDAPDSPLGLVVLYGAAVLLVSMGLAVVRLLPKKEVSR
jgi:hypothetical protein